ncbi:hypothetical protein QTO34_019380 [Cnephaeus nilssonii]|uniref:Uncharacterized protein n=1 Tax=Cnephaeus nilssonii TaxID=3371016 RepID=A0AA40HWT9_CNENI|nr:hypothetical protein QTO34_019380 [Eptesicus nilssonii]
MALLVKEAVVTLIEARRGLLMAREKRNKKNQNEILKLLEAVWEPKEIAVTRKGKTQHQKETNVLMPPAKLAAKEQVAPSWIMLAPELPEPPKYTPQEEEWSQQEGGKRTKEGWLCRGISHSHGKGTAVHPYKPGDQVWVKDWNKEPLHLLEGILSSHIYHPHSSQGCRTEYLDPPLPGEGSPPTSDAQPKWKVTSDQKHPLRITLKKTTDLAINLLQGIQKRPAEFSLTLIFLSYLLLKPSGSDGSGMVNGGSHCWMANGEPREPGWVAVERDWGLDSWGSGRIMEGGLWGSSSIEEHRRASWGGGSSFVECRGAVDMALIAGVGAWPWAVALGSAAPNILAKDHRS